MQKQKGFTLIEILVVVSIIGILASIVLIGVNDARQKARDARRVSDLYQITQAIEMYNNANGKYPTDLVANLASYFPKGIPKDPNSNNSYNYFYSNPKCFILQAKLDRNNPDILKRNMNMIVQCGQQVDCLNSSLDYCVGNNQ